MSILVLIYFSDLLRGRRRLPPTPSLSLIGIACHKPVEAMAKAMVGATIEEGHLIRDSIMMMIPP